MSKDLLGIAGLSPEKVLRLLEMAQDFKRGLLAPSLSGKSVALLFDKPSLRTRVSFEVAIHQLGGQAVTLGGLEVRGREPVADVARVLSRYVHGIVLRASDHGLQEEMARHATVPVINGLSDREHPCQVLADLLTIRERKGRLRGLTVTFIGDGNNVATSLALACSLVGSSFRMASPPGYGLPEEVLALARANGARSGARVQCGEDPREAVRGADVVYTDVWVSMGQEEERERRLRAFQGYQVTAELLDQAQPDCLFLHDLPAHHGEEIAWGLLEHPRSAVFDQAENRLHAAKAVLAQFLGPGAGGLPEEP